MNIALLLKPKALVAFVYNDYTVRQTIEKLEHYHYSAIPMIDREGKYVGSISEGDLLWYIKDQEQFSLDDMEEVSVTEVVRYRNYQPIRINAKVEDLLSIVIQQNFVPVIDDRDMFIGIVTRQDVMTHLIKK